ncbi:MAG: hypothetical protein H0X25_04460 [Acidobacteriales bacterium]|nr:hypothetical protein [Terriglobales bacterium]
MFRVMGYDAGVKVVRGFAVAALGLCMACAASAQIHGVPSSVTSIGFGGNFSVAPGVPASVTSIGTIGFPPNCCINPLFPTNPNPSLFHHRNHGGFGGGGGGVAVYPVPYAVPVPVPYDNEEQGAPPTDEQYVPSANVYDRRGPAAPPPVAASTLAPATTETAEPEPVSSQPQTLLVFKDGHQMKVENYAIVGDTLFDLTEGHRRKIPLADLDLTATVQQNDDHGIQFTVPDN